MEAFLATTAAAARATGITARAIGALPVAGLASVVSSATVSSAATSSSAASTDTAVDKGAGCPENTAPPRECRSASVMSGALSGNTTSRRAADGVALILSSSKPLPSPILICAEPYALANRATHLHRQAHGGATVSLDRRASVGLQI